MVIIQPEQMARLKRFSLTAKAATRGHHKGIHRSNRLGASLDFSDYREYHVGDDIRQVDWNVFARTEKHYIKRFLDEQEMRIHFLLDTTKSMGLHGKSEFSKLITAMLALIALDHGDTISLTTTPKEPLLRRKGTAGVVPLLKRLEMPNCLDGSFASEMMKQLPKASTIIYVISDGLEQTDQLIHLFDRLISYGKDVRWVRIYSSEEERTDYTGDREMIDIETNEKINVSMSLDIQKQYIEARKKHFGEINYHLSKHNIISLDLKVEEGFQGALQQLLHARWIK